MFLKEKINMENVRAAKFLWHFPMHDHDMINIEIKFISILENNNALHKFYKSDLWYGCFGAMSVIEYSFIEYRK